jgi:hypothetical protein
VQLGVYVIAGTISGTEKMLAELKDKVQVHREK